MSTHVVNVPSAPAHRAARRAAVLAVAASLLFLLSGDRLFTSGINGIDPLEILNLQIKPNVFVILDTSGSMQETPYTATQTGGDLKQSKMYLAKQVMKGVFQANQTKAQFLFGVYRFATPAPSTAQNMNQRVASKPNRFMYSTQAYAGGTFANPACTVDPTTCPSPNPSTVTLAAEGPSPSMLSTELRVNSLYAYQWIQGSGNVINNTLYFTEASGASCTVTIPSGFYRSGADLAAAVEAAMNGCAGRANSYRVQYGTRTIDVTSITRSGTTATVTTSVPHAYVTGDSVTIAGASPTGYNGAKTITVTSATTFTYAVVNTLTTPATGTITAATAAATANRFIIRGSGASSWTLRFGSATSTIGGVLGPNATADVTRTGTNLWTSGDPRVNLLQRSSTDELVENYDPDGASTTLVPTLDKPSPKRDVTTYLLYAQKFWNGQTVYVDSSGNACDIAAGTPTTYPSITLQLTTNCANGAASADPANKATFDWGGGEVSGTGSCQGFQQKVPLIPCNQLTPPQYDNIAPFLENQLPITATGTIDGYSESTDGTGTVLANPAAGGVIASGNTPLAQSLNDIRTIYAALWNTGQASPSLDAIKNHLNPKEKTIVLMVTDGDQNCSPFTQGSSSIGSAPYNPTSMSESDAAALGAAAAAQRLYDPAVNGTGSGATVAADGTINGDSASSVTTYVVAFGAGAAKDRADWIAWGGSGMRQTLGSYSGQPTWTTIPTAAQRSSCKTCIDSFLAPDPDTLKEVLEKVINQGASTGEFSAQQSITASVFEFVGDTLQGTAPIAWSPFNPRNRYDPVVPLRIVSTFALPLFTGQLRAYSQGGPASLATTDASCAYTVQTDANGNQYASGSACRRWSANDLLVSRVTTGMAAACPAVAAAGVAASQCNFVKLKGTSTAQNVASGNAGIKRRIYTMSQNGVYGPTYDQLIAGTSPYRLDMWPPDVTVAPASDTTQGVIDAALGLPTDTAAAPATEFTAMQTSYHACKGTPLPAACSSATALTRMKRARREAREMIIAFLAGAQFVPDANGDPKRATAASGSYAAGDILYAARSAILAESTVATPAVVGPPQEEEPAEYGAEWKLYRDGARDNTHPPEGANPGGASWIYAGFGLRNPDRDGLNTVTGVVNGRTFYANDTRTDVKPAMTVVYAGTNSALHAFRAGPTVATTISTACVPSATVECGGEELWAFVPYDQLGKLKSRYLGYPEKRDPHNYMIARAIRFSDVFVPVEGTTGNPSGVAQSKTYSGVNLGNIKGVWRKVIFFGRGIGGKYVTAIDVTASGPFTRLALDPLNPGPIALWSRGNPDTSNGLAQGQPGATLNNTVADYDSFLKMGETWSVPAVAYVGKDTASLTNPSNKAMTTTRKSNGTDFALYMGSGYGDTGEGTTFYTLDALTGDVVAAVDVEQTAAANYPELVRTGLGYSNALVANPIVYNASRYIYDVGGVASPNVAAQLASRAYIGDLYGRVWKFLAAGPDVAIPVADLGPDQPVAIAGSLIGLPANGGIPYLFVTSGNDSRVSAQFRNYGFVDRGLDGDRAVTSIVTSGSVNTYLPVESAFTLDMPTDFRGTIQPATAYADDGSTNPPGRVFFGGTRFNGPNSPNAPAVPPYPCRSSFDSVIYAVGAETGGAAYGLSGGLPYMILQDSRLVALSLQASPIGSQLVPEEGLAKTGNPVTPPPPTGLAPTTQATANVVLTRAAGAPQPAIRFGSVVCQ